MTRVAKSSADRADSDVACAVRRRISTPSAMPTKPKRSSNKTMVWSKPCNENGVNSMNKTFPEMFA